MAEDTDMKTMLDALTARVNRLEDERAILDTLHRYGQAADRGDDAIWADLFTEDGVFVAFDRGGQQLFRLAGRDELAPWLRKFRAGETRLSKHVVLAPVIEIDGANALVKSYLTRLIENADPYQSPMVLLMGRYDDEMVRGADGKWRFRTRTAHTEAPLFKRD
jgi:hypothetical protein